MGKYLCIWLRITERHPWLLSPLTTEDAASESRISKTELMCHLYVMLDQPGCAQGPNHVLQVMGTWHVLVSAGLVWEAAAFSRAGGWMAQADLTVQCP